MRDIENACVPKYKKNPKLLNAATENTEGDLDELLDLINDENETDNGEENLDELLSLINNEENDDVDASNNTERKKVFIKKDKHPDSTQKVADETNSESTVKPAAKSSITITKIPKDDVVLVEKNTQIRLVKSSFKSEIELNMRLISDFGKFLKLSDVNRRSCEIKESGTAFKWFSIFLLGSKTDSKCSANGNNYVIWRIYDATNLDKQQEITLFLFGNAYKTHWKSSEFEAFALIQPDILDSNKNGAQAGNKTATPYFNGSNTPTQKAGNYKSATGWNNFAAKKVDLDNKLTLSVKADYQLIPLGIAKDMTHCQSHTTATESSDSSKRCKNLVNLQEAPYCVYHCKQLDKSNKFGKHPVAEGKYSMNKPTNRFGTQPLFGSTVTPDVKFVSNFRSSQQPAAVTKLSMIEQRQKVCKEIKTEILNSLNSSIAKTIDPSINIMGKGQKKTDQELMALLDGKQLDKEEIKKIRIAEQSTVVRMNGDIKEANKEMTKLFSSKILLPNEKTCNSSITSSKMLEFKKSQSAVKIADSEYSSFIKKKYEDNQANYKLSTLASHKEICKQIKDKPVEEAPKQTAPVQAGEKPVKPLSSNSIVASDFLKSRMKEITTKKTAPPAPTLSNKSGFDLELYIGDSLTSKKLLDVDSKYISFSPTTATSAGYKRKLQELNGTKGAPKPAKDSNSPKLNESLDEKKSKKLKLIDDLLSIKSKYSKDANDPEKNPHLKSYYDKLQVQESIDNKLAGTKNREVNAVTCNTCSYTSFSQSDYCRKLNHSISRHKSIQRYFKCKICNKRTHTLDKLYPSASCGQCGANMFEACGMKELDTSLNAVREGSSLEQASEMLLEHGDD